MIYSTFSLDYRIRVAGEDVDIPCLIFGDVMRDPEQTSWQRVTQIDQIISSPWSSVSARGNAIKTLSFTTIRAFSSRPEAEFWSREREAILNTHPQGLAIWRYAYLDAWPSGQELWQACVAECRAESLNPEDWAGSRPGHASQLGAWVAVTYSFLLTNRQPY